MNKPSQTTRSSTSKKLVSIGAAVMATAACLWVVGRLVLTYQIYSLPGRDKMPKEEVLERLAFIQTALTTVDIATIGLFLIGGAIILYAYLKGRK